MSTLVSTDMLPTALQRKLRIIRRRWLVLTAVRGLLLSAVVLTVAMLFAMGVDWIWVLFDPLIRLTVTIAAVAASVATVALIAIRGSRRVWHDVALAQLVDARVPALQQRWGTVTSMAQPPRTTRRAIEKSMVDQVTSEAVVMQSLVHPSEIAPTAVLRPAAIAAVVCIGLLVVFLSVRWELTSVLLQRFWSPTSSITATTVADVSGDRLIPRGETIELFVRQAGVQRSQAALTVVSESGVRETFSIAPTADDELTFMHPIAIDASMSYQFQIGDARTTWHTLTAIDYPRIDKVELTVTAPRYIDQPVVRKQILPRRLTVAQGSQLTLAIKPTARLAKLVLAIDAISSENGGEPETVQELELTADADGWYRFETELTVDQILRPQLTSPEGLFNEVPLATKIEVIVDRAPIARVLQPDAEVAVAIDESLEIEFEAHDDHGIASADFVIYDETNLDAKGQPTVIAVQPIPLHEQRLQKHVRGKTQLDLSALDLQPGSNISYSIRVSDNRHMADDVDRDGNDELAHAEATGAPDEATGAPDEATGAPDEATGAPDAAAPLDADPAGAAAQLALPPGDPSPVPGGEIAAAKVAGNKNAADKSAGDKIASDEPASGADRSMTTDTDDVDTNPASSTAASASKPQSKATPDSPASNRDVDGPPLDLSPKLDIASPSDRGQNTQTARRRLKVTERLAALSPAVPADKTNQAIAEIREKVVAIDAMLGEAEAVLQQLVDHAVADSQRGNQFQSLDDHLAAVETAIATLRRETKENEFAFVGLQTVELGRTHITPARDRVFAAARDPNAGHADANAKIALAHVNRARELMAKLLDRYDTVQRERDLKRAFDETATIYEVYVEKTQQLLRESRQNRHPLVRKLGILEVDQEYLDRYAEVLGLRRDMMAEFAALLGDDPRLLSRYLELTQRRQRSLRDEFHQLVQRQDELAMELAGWLQIHQDHRGDLWQIIAELRLRSVAQIAEDADVLAERIEAQMPLRVDAQQPTPQAVIHYVQQLARSTRTLALDIDRQLSQPPLDYTVAVEDAEKLLQLITNLDQALDRLQFEHQDDPEIVNYVQPRLLESRSVTSRAQSWAMLVNDLAVESYDSIVAIEQHRLAAATERMRVEMLEMEADLDTQFQTVLETGLPAELVDMVRTLHQMAESITWHQAAAAIAAEQQRLPEAAEQQQLAVLTFEQAEDLFDQLRQAVVEALDQYEPPNPNIADLRDPTLDSFLAQLEREPNINSLLGIPARPSNIRVIADSMLWKQSGSILGGSGDAAMQRARQAMQRQRGTLKLSQADQQGSNSASEDRDPTDEDKETAAQDAQRMLEESLLAIRAQQDRPETSDEQRQKLQQMAQEIESTLQNAQQDPDATDVWQQLAQTDQAQAILQALATGQTVPDSQWNKLLSTLGDGLWQVRGRQPPEQYREAIQQYQDKVRQLLGQQTAVASGS